MKYSICILALLAACGGPTSNPDTITVPDAGTPDVIVTPDTTPSIDTTPGIDTTPAPIDTTPGIDTTPVTPDTGKPDLGTDTTPAPDAACPAGKFGSKCNFDATQFAAWKVFCPSESGRLEIANATGSESYLNGYYIDVPVGAVDRCSIFFLSPALGVNLPAPATGKIVPVAHGLEVVAVDKDMPLLTDGSLNKVSLLADVGIFFNNNRGQVSLFDSGAFTNLATTIVQTGTLGKTKHFSPFYLNVGEPVVAASASHAGNREVLIDFTGTVHAGSATPYLLQFAVAEGGTPLTLTASDNSGLRFRTMLAGGTHVLSATVADQYGDVGTKQVSLTVDLCSTTSCASYQTCRATDGVCVGSDPCAPSPCVHGTCSSSTGSAVCTSCADGWKGPLCDQQDLCFGKTCSSHGTCDASNGVCKCDSTWTGTDCSTPVVVDLCAGKTCNDSLYCNGTESCDPGTGLCVRKDVPSCNSHGSCNEFTDSCSCDTNFGGPSCNTCATGTVGTYPNCVADLCANVSCNGNGTCNSGTGACQCSTGFDPNTNCSSCLTGYSGPTCTLTPPTPTISGLGIDCSADGGYCITGITYHVSWSFTNATSFSSSTTIISGCSAEPGTLSPSSGSLTGSSKTVNYTVGNDCSPATSRITITVSGPGGQVSSSIDVVYY